MKTYLPDQLMREVSTRTGLPFKDTKLTVETLVNAMRDHLVDGDRVKLGGLGFFELRETAARTGRNPQTGEKMEIAARVRVVFKPIKALKDV